MTRKTSLIWLWGMIALTVRAQTGLILETWNGYSSNAFLNAQALPDWMHSGELQIHQDWLGDTRALRLYYRGELNLFQEYETRRFHAHKTGFQYYHILSASGNRLNAGGYGRIRRHTETYQWFEAQEFYAYINIKWVVSPSLYMYLGANTRKQSYPNLSFFSHRNDAVFLKGSLFMNTGTSLHLELDRLEKVYDAADPAEAGTGDLPIALSEGGTVSNQWVTLLKIGQALSPGTGLSIQGLIRRSGQNASRYLGTDTGFYFSEEELFHDTFATRAEAIDLTLKHRFPHRWTASWGGGLSRIRYDKRLALDLEGNPVEGNPLRHDNRAYLMVESEKRWLPGGSGPVLSWMIQARYFENRSNDLYYDAQGFLLTTGLRLSR